MRIDINYELLVEESIEENAYRIHGELNSRTTLEGIEHTFSL